MQFSVYLSCMHFPSDAGIADQVEEPIKPAARDSKEDRSIDPDDARDYAYSLFCAGGCRHFGAFPQQSESYC